MSTYYSHLSSIQNLAEEAISNLEKIDRDKLQLSSDFKKWKGGSLRLFFIESKFVQKIFYYLHVDFFLHVILKFYKHDLEKTLKQYLPESKLSDDAYITKVKREIRKLDWYIQARPYEYFFLNLSGKCLKEQKEYVTDKYMLQKMSMMNSRRLHDLELNEKYNFYLLAKPFFKREVFLINDKANLKEFTDIALRHKKMIFKPTSLGCGGGIFVADVSSEYLIQETFNKLMNQGGTWVAEELIVQSAIMSEWNSSSVNTVRILSFRTKKGIEFTNHFMRTGRKGKVVDNGGSGGVFAAIDPKTGVVISDGVDEYCNTYVNHPDSNIQFKGWQVPRWEELVETVKAIHTIVFPEMKYVGWDFALTDSGWVVIEGNWGQFIHQAALNKGLRSEFDRLLNS